MLFHEFPVEKTRAGGPADSWDKPLPVPFLTQNQQAVLLKMSKEIIPSPNSTLSSTPEAVKHQTYVCALCQTLLTLGALSENIT